MPLDRLSGSAQSASHPKLEPAKTEAKKDAHPTVYRASDRASPSAGRSPLRSSHPRVLQRWTSQVKLVCIPQRVRVEHRWMEIAHPSSRASEYVRRPQKNERQIFSHLLLHQLIEFALPPSRWLGLVQVPQMRGAIKRPDVHLRIRIRIAAAQPHDRSVIIETLKNAIDHGAKFQRNRVHLHPQVRKIVLQQRRHLHALAIRRTGDDREFDGPTSGIQQLARGIPRISP